MKVIFGLGNPGLKYKNNRDNIGYKIIEAVAKKENSSFKKKINLHAWVANANPGVKNEPLCLIKPNVFMNNSGQSLGLACSKYKVSAVDILVVYDDIDLPLGAIRFRKSGSCGGHRGMESMIEASGTEKIKRLKIGIGRSPGVDAAEYVLSDFNLLEQKALKNVIEQAACACIDWVNQGEDFVMRNYNCNLKN